VTGEQRRDVVLAALGLVVIVALVVIWAVSR
jgi:hypothetical protein